MQSPAYLFRSLGVGLVLALASLSCIAPAPAPPTTAATIPAGAIPTRPPVTAPTSSPAPTIAPASEVPFEQQFIDMMVPHHEGAIEIARIAQQRAEHPEVKQLADDILRSQDAEIAQMRKWRQEWYGSSTTPPMTSMPMLSTNEATSGSPHTMDMAADVDRLRSATGPFDLVFIDAMIPHHQSAVDAAFLARKQSTRPEIENLALDILEAQQREIGQMRAWRLSWIQPASGAPGPTPPSGVIPGVTMPTPTEHMVPGEDMNH